jgi:hypothetical protein
LVADLFYHLLGAEALMASMVSTARAGAALFTAPAIWAAHQLTSYALVAKTCRDQLVFIPLPTLPALVVIAAAVFVSLRARKATSSDIGLSRAQRFLTEVGLFTAALFAFAIGLQGIAAMILSGCQQ